MSRVISSNILEKIATLFFFRYTKGDVIKYVRTEITNIRENVRTT